MRTYLIAGLIGLSVGGSSPLTAQDIPWPKVRVTQATETGGEPKTTPPVAQATAGAQMRTPKVLVLPEVSSEYQPGSADRQALVTTSSSPRLPWDEMTMKEPTDNRFDTASMIAPLQAGNVLLGRLELSQGLLADAQVIASGTRTDNVDDMWVPETYTWISPVFYHQPLYFEQPNLERYGLGGPRIVQPILSSAHFFGSIPLVPYKTLTQHPREKVYTLGQGRPGNCVPIQRHTLLGQSTVGEVFWYWEGSRGY